MRWLKTFDTREVVKLGHSLADQLVAGIAERGGGRKKKPRAEQYGQQLQTFLQRIDSEARPLKLGLLRRAKLANTFKWRLLEKGLAPGAVDELTQMLLLRLSQKQRGA
jgi:hypothetical protein